MFYHYYILFLNTVPLKRYGKLLDQCIMIYILWTSRLSRIDFFRYITDITDNLDITDTTDILCRHPCIKEITNISEFDPALSYCRK
jgi:hypothetical protein